MTRANRLLRAALKAGKRSKPHKYGAKATTVDGIRFHSLAEARRYQELKLLENAGEIGGLVFQVPYDLHAFGAKSLNHKVVGKYVADFAYFDNRRHCRVVEDVKGIDTPLSKWKRKHVLAQYEIAVEIVK